jgi:hypothetical protein
MTMIDIRDVSEMNTLSEAYPRLCSDRYHIRIRPSRTHLRMTGGKTSRSGDRNGRSRR